MLPIRGQLRSDGSLALHSHDPGKSERLRRLWMGRITPILGVALVSGAAISAVFSQWLAPFDPTVANLSARLAPPSWLAHTQGDHFVLGADAIGRDILSRIIFGSRIALEVGLTSVAISVLIGVFIGLLAGYYGGLFDELTMRLADAQLAFPFILMALTVMAVLGPGLWKVILIMALTQWVQYARVIRGEVLSVREREFIQAARAEGASNSRILFRHILPNVLSSIIVLGTLNIANNILLEAALTFLGLGVDPTIPSWGGMLADGRNYIETAWWLTTFPGIAIMLTIMGFNLLGDWLRDRLDPNLKV